MKNRINIGITIILLSGILFSKLSAQSPLPFVPDGMNMNSRVPVGTLPASTLDFTKTQDYTGNVSLPISLVSLGGVDVQLKYYSKDMPNQIRTENRYAPSGSLGLGWQLQYGSISGEINASVDTSDDRYFYNGPDGSFQLQEGQDGVFRIPGYKPWIIRREMISDTIAGWTIIKENGTILRFGNYNMTTGQFQLSFDSPSATRFSIGYDGLVSNPDRSRYSTSIEIPYQWDLSNVQDIQGNQTTLTYTQVKDSLVTDVAHTGTYYTRESHPYQILDNKGNVVQFNYSPMSSNEYYNNYATYWQNLVDTLFLNSIQIQRNGQLSKQIVFSYASNTDIMSLGIAKRFLVGFTFKDENGISLPSYKFDYYFSSADVNPGALKCVTNPAGGMVTYTYATQTLPNVQLSKDTVVNPIAYYDYYNEKPNDDGMAGKDFVVVRSSDNTLYVNRQGPTGWYRDTSFPYTTSDYVKVANDYIVLYSLSSTSLYAVKRTLEGWKTYDVNDALTAEGDTLGDYGVRVIGVGPNYFVVKYNGQGDLNIYPSWEVSIIMFSPTKLNVYNIPLGTQERGRFYDGGATNSLGGQRQTSMRAFCGENYMVLANAGFSGSDNTNFLHFRYSSVVGQWTNVVNHSTVNNGWFSAFDLDHECPHRVYIGKNFVVVALNDFSHYTELKVYRRDGSDILLVDWRVADKGVGNIVVADDYYAYTYVGTNIDCIPDLITIRTWNGSSFIESVNTTFQSLFNMPNWDLYRMYLTALDNRLIVNCTATGYNIWYTGYVTYSPANGWLQPGKIIHQQNLSSLVGCGTSTGVALNQNTFVEMCYGSMFPCQAYANPNLILMHAYQFHGDSVVCTTIDSIWTGHYRPSDWIWQPGGNFFAIARGGTGTGGIPNADSLNVYTLNNLPSGGMQFQGSPTTVVVSQKTYADGLGGSAVHNYTFENGVANQSFTPEYGNVTEILPDNNGRILTSYYTCRDSIVGGLNYKDLDGMVYCVKEYNNQGTVVREKQSTWDVTAIDSINGVFFQKLIKDSTLTDGVAKVTSYEYSDIPLDPKSHFQVAQVIEKNGNGAQRITKMRYPLDYTLSSGQDTMTQALDSLQNGKHIVNAVIEKWVAQPQGGDTIVVAAELTKWKVFNSIQTLPQYQLKLHNYTPVTNFIPSSVNSGTFVYDTRYVVQQTYDSYDDHGNILQQTDANNIRTTTKWGNNSLVPVATFQNADSSETSADNFDDGSISDGNPFNWITVGTWSCTSGVLRSNGSAYAGKPFSENSSFKTDVAVHIINDYGNPSNWAAIHIGNTSGNVFSNGYIILYRSNGYISLYTDGALQTSVSTGILPSTWRRLSVSVDGTVIQAFLDGQRFINYTASNTVTGVNIGLYSYVADTEFDDFRSYPLNTLTRSYEYDTVRLLPTRITDENGVWTNFTYDTFGRLHSISDHRNTRLKEIDYAPDLRAVRALEFVSPNRINNSSLEDQLMVYRQNPAQNQLLPKDWILVGCSTISDSMKVTLTTGFHGSSAFVLSQGSQLLDYKLRQNIGRLKVGKTYKLSCHIGGNAYIKVYYSSGQSIITWSGYFNFQYLSSATFQITRDEDVYIDLCSPYSYNTNGVYDYLCLFATDDPYTTGSSYDLLPGYSDKCTDGLGKEISSVVQQRKGGDLTRGWIMTKKYYDSIGRLTRYSVPYLKDSLFYPRLLLDTYRYQTVYSSDPLNRITAQGTDGGAWDADDPNSHAARFSYGRNDQYINGWGPNLLNKNRKVDENSVPTDTYTDAFGNTIATIVDPDSLNLRTSFLYDITGNLLQSIDPDNKSSEYSYNTFGQMTEKITPDAGHQRYLYDRMGNLRLKEDASHIKDVSLAVFNPISGTGNEVYTRTYPVSMQRPGRILVHLETQTPWGEGLKVKILAANGTILYNGATDGYMSNYNEFLYYLPKGSYTCEIQSTVTIGTSYSVTCTKWCKFVYTKCDSHNRVIEVGEYESGMDDADFTQANADLSSFPSSDCLVQKKFIYDIPADDPLVANQRNLKGRISTALSYRLGNLALTTHYSYDDRGRVEWIVHQGFGVVNPRIEYSYDMQGRVVGKVYNDLAGAAYSRSTQYLYDQAGRLWKTLSSPNSYPSKMQDYVYHYPYQLTYGYNNGMKPIKVYVGGSFAAFNLSYNQREWLTRINNWIFDDSLEYNAVSDTTASRGVKPQYNGNISSAIYTMYGVNWRPPNVNEQTQKVGYCYKYDRANRLTEANFRYYYGRWKPTFSYGANYSYSGNGNFLNTRVYGYAITRLMDSLQYCYSPGSNRLRYLIDSVATTAYTADVENQVVDNYIYDDNGNMKQDLMSDIGFTIYDINNQPLSIHKKSNGTCYKYTYDTQGNRIIKSALNLEYYINGADGRTEAVVKSNNTQATHNIWGLDLVGQARRDYTTWKRYYYIKDHLGTVKMIIDSAYYTTVKSYDDFYPFGMIMEQRSANNGVPDTRYKFVSNERDVETGLDNLGSRMYDNRIGRSFTVDRFAEKDPTRSPYSYAGNNPIVFVDEHGDSIVLRGQDLNKSLGLVQEWVDKDSKRLSMGENGRLLIDLEDYKKGNNQALDDLIEMNNAEEHIGFEVNDKIEYIDNQSVTHRYEDFPDKGIKPHGSWPPKGLEGNIVFPTRTEYSEDNGTEIPRGRIVGHEMKENYIRTHYSINYFGAHSIANIFYFGGTTAKPIKVKLK